MRVFLSRPVAAPLGALRDSAARFPGATGGMGAVEFSLILPIMAFFFFGLNETTLGVNIDRKLTLASRSLADLTSRAPKMDTTEMANIFTATTAIMQPFQDVPVQMVVSSVIVTKNGTTYTGAIDWSCSKNVGTKPGTTGQADWDKANLKKRTAGESYAVPSGFEGGSSFIVAEVLRPYKPTTGYMFTGTIPLRETTPWPVRNVSSVTKPSSCPA